MKMTRYARLAERFLLPSSARGAGTGTSCTGSRTDARSAATCLTDLRVPRRGEITIAIRDQENDANRCRHGYSG
jgi:hypothetical protein